MAEFKGILSKFDFNHWQYHIPIANEIALSHMDDSNRRVLIWIQGEGLFSSVYNFFFIGYTCLLAGRWNLAFRIKTYDNASQYFEKVKATIINRRVNLVCGKLVYQIINLLIVNLLKDKIYRVCLGKIHNLKETLRLSQPLRQPFKLHLRRSVWA